MPKLINEVGHTIDMTRFLTWGAIFLFCLWTFGSLVGCAIEATKPAAKVVVNSVLIDAQYDLAVSNYRQLDLNESERIISEDAFAKLGAMRTYLKTVDSVELGIMTLLRSQSAVDTVAYAYEMLEDTYVGHVERKGLLPDPAFVALKLQADDLILSAYTALDTLDTSDDRLTRVSELLAYLLQGVALSKAF